MFPHKELFPHQVLVPVLLAETGVEHIDVISRANFLFVFSTLRGQQTVNKDAERCVSRSEHAPPPPVPPQSGKMCPNPPVEEQPGTRVHRDTELRLKVTGSVTVTRL